MLALPTGVSGLGVVLLACGLVAAVALAAFLWTGLRASLGRGASGATALVAALALASALGPAPFFAWRIVQDLRYTTTLPGRIAERMGAYESFLDAASFDTIAAAIPPGDTYFVASTKEGGGLFFLPWARTALLPRIAVGDPHDADWLLTYGVDPRALGLEVEGVREIPTSYGGSAPRTYLARVAR